MARAAAGRARAAGAVARNRRRDGSGMGGAFRARGGGRLCGGSADFGSKVKEKPLAFSPSNKLDSIHECGPAAVPTAAAGVRPMPDATPFLQAILDAMNNDAPRLVYADWLEERGDPHGELIRVQCELARRRIGDPARRDLEQRERRLLSKHYLAWYGPLKSLREDADPTRGFLPPVKISGWQALYGHWVDSPL